MRRFLVGRGQAMLLALGLAAVSGCQTAPIKMAKVNSGNWRARALIKDKDHSRSFIVFLDFNAIRDQAIRVDVMSTLGQQVASIVATKTEVRYYTSETKKFYVGQPKPDVLRPILAIPLDPMLLQNVLFDLPITSEYWICQNGDDKLVANCHDDASGLTVTWSGRKGAARTIQITHPKAEIQINVRSFSEQLETTDHLFDLQMPAGYQKFKVR